MHHKFCIIDGPKAIKRKSILKAYAEKLNFHAQFSKQHVKQQPKGKPAKAFVMSGSLNWSTQAMVSNHESVIVTSHPNIVSKFEKEFESLWVETEPVNKIFPLICRYLFVFVFYSIMFLFLSAGIVVDHRIIFYYHHLKPCK